MIKTALFTPFFMAKLHKQESNGYVNHAVYSFKSNFILTSSLAEFKIESLDSVQMHFLISRYAGDYLASGFCWPFAPSWEIMNKKKQSKRAKADNFQSSTTHQCRYIAAGFCAFYVSSPSQQRIPLLVSIRNEAFWGENFYDATRRWCWPF